MPLTGPLLITVTIGLDIFGEGVEKVYFLFLFATFSMLAGFFSFGKLIKMEKVGYGKFEV